MSTTDQLILHDSERRSCTAAEALATLYSGELLPSRTPYSFVVVGKGKEARWLIDTRARSSLQEVWKSWIPYSRKSRLLWLTVRWMAKLGLLRLIPGVSRMEIPAREFGAWTKTVPELRDCTAIVFVGKPSTTVKLTAFLAGETGKIAAVMKIALTSAAKASVANESEALRRLHGTVPGVPPLIASEPHHGVCLQGWMDGTSCDRRLTRSHVDLLLSLPKSGKHKKLRCAFQEIAGGVPQEFRSIAERYVLPDRCDMEIPAVPEHGDFVPWNMKQLADGSLCLLDWEYYRPHSLPLLDLLHFFYRQEFLFRDRLSSHAMIAKSPLVKSYSSALYVSSEVVPELEMLYLLRCLHDRLPPNRFGESYASFIDKKLTDLAAQYPRIMSVPMSSSRM